MRCRRISRKCAAIVIAAWASFPAMSSAAMFTWNGANSTFGTMSTGNDWVGGASPYTASSGTADLLFASTNPHGFNPTMNGALAVNSLTFNTSALAYTLITNGSGFSGILTIGTGGLTDNATNAQSITGATAVATTSAAQNWNIASGSFTDSTPVTLNGDLTVNTISASASAMFSGALSGSLHTLSKTGVGTLTLSGGGSIHFLEVNGGATNISTGKLTLGSVLHVDSGTLTVSGGATLDASGDTGFNEVGGATGPSMTLTGGSKYIEGNEFDVGTGDGLGILNVSSNSQMSSQSLYVGYHGAGVLSVASSGTVNSGALFLGKSGSAGMVNVSGGGAVIISGKTTFYDNITPNNISGGTFTTGSLSSGNPGIGVITLADPDGGTALTINDPTAAHTNTYSGTISGTGSLLKSGASTQVLSGNINTSGTATVTAGTLTFSGTGNSSIAALSVTGATTNLTAGTLKLTSTYTGLAVTGGSLNISGGTLDASATTNYTSIDAASVMVAGATSQLKGGNEVDVGESSSSLATLTVALGAQVSTGTLFVPYNGAGMLSVISGGIVNVNHFEIGGGFGGSINISGASAVNVTGNTDFNSSTLPLNISGGTLTTGGLYSFNGYGLINLIADPAGGTALTLNALSGSVTYFGNISGAGSLLKSGAATQVLSGIDTFTGSVKVTGGVLEFASRNKFSSLTISGGIAQINGSGNILVVPTLAITTGGTLDITKDSADLAGSSLQSLTTLAQKGFNGGTWTGTGLTSSSAAADTRHLTAVGVIQNNQSGIALYTAINKFEGITPGPADVLAKYTYYGDTNLDGKVDGSDYSRIDSAFVADKINPTAQTGWFNGDFNYDGVINGSDYTLIDNAFNTQGAQLSDQIASPTAQLKASAVPEPTGALLLIPALALLKRRGKKR